MSPVCRRSRTAKHLRIDRGQARVFAKIILEVFGICFSSFPAWGASVWLSAAATKPDFLDMFQANAPWEHAAKSIEVFKFSSQFLDQASDTTLRAVFDDLKRRHIALAWEALMLTATPACGRGVEGYAGAGTIARIARKLRRLGGDLRYVAMDEPLWFARFSDLPHACHAKVVDLAREVAAKVQVIRRSFPDARVGDIEGVGVRVPADWVNEILRWSGAYRSAVGRPLSFVDADITPDGPWQAQSRSLASGLRSRGITFGMIYRGNPDDQTNLDWCRHAETMMTIAQDDPAIRPGQVIIQTWMPYPTRMLPETQPGTLTWLVGRYLAGSTRLTFGLDGDWLEGQLTDSAGRSLAGRVVGVSAAITGKPDKPAGHVLAGHVPANAVRAVFALRVNAECQCSGAADVYIGPMRYHDDRTGETSERAFKTVVGATGGIVAHVDVQPGQATKQNAPDFAVSAGDSYTMSVPIWANWASSDSGYVALLFLDRDGMELARVKIRLSPVKRPIATTTTNDLGRFSVLLDPATLSSSVGFAAAFGGDAQDRLASATLIHAPVSGAR